MRESIQGHLENEAVLFLTGKGLDPRGRHIDDYFKFTAEQWEQCHDHIQWAFPSIIPSRFNPTAPVITEQFVDSLDYDILRMCRMSIGELIVYYRRSIGMPCYKAIDGIRAREWASDGFNHNFNRITRIILCQRVWGTVSLYDDAISLPELLQKVVYPYWGNDSLRTAFGFWLEATYCKSPWDFGK